jgi:hypothetical protein
MDLLLFCTKVRLVRGSTQDKKKAAPPISGSAAKTCR